MIRPKTSTRINGETVAMQFGANTVLFGTHPLRTALEYIRLAGYSGAEISALSGCGAFGDPLGEHLHLDRWEEDVPDIAAAAAEFELALTAIEVGPLDEERIASALHAAAELAIPVINIGPSGRSDAPGDLEACIRRLSPLAEKAEECKVMLCVKPHIGASIYDTKTALEALREIPTPYFGIDFDPSHLHRVGEDVLTAWDALASRVGHVHIRDSGPGPEPGSPIIQTCGRGEVDLVGLVARMIESGYEGPVNLEIIGASTWELPRSAMIAAESYGFLNACVKAAQR